MASTPTATWALRYPAGTPGVPPDVKTDLQNLASDTDAALTKLKGDNTWTTAPLAAATNWAVDTTTPGLRLVAGVVYIKVRFNYTGSGVSAGASGNFSDIVVANLGSTYVAKFAPAYITYKDFVIPGSSEGKFRINSAGQIAITNMTPNTSFASGTALQFDDSWPVG